MTFSSILIANRGEIARRVIRTARAMGYRTVAVYSDADENAPHVREAHEAVRLGPAPAAESYLNMDAVLAAARFSGAQAVHPGYGFLSENTLFAERLAAEGLVFIGPPASAIAAMGDKASAKRVMEKAGVPTIPGYHGEDQSGPRLAAEAAEIGFPVMVKAAAGGGGRGMRLVQDAGGLAEAVASAAREAQNAFGSGALLLEKAILRGRHVEVQIFADTHGNIVHLGERDCSLQRRNQKVIEEAPSPAVNEALRAQLGASAVEAARAVGYAGAGTVEFMLDEDGAFYFLEMNTRLQVEHPVTECVTGQDLVAWQIDVAAGLPLPLSQDEIALAGHAIEARLYAEDPFDGFRPQTGQVLDFAAANPSLARTDGGVEAGSDISPHYDPMVAKVIATGRTRSEAVRRLIAALQETHLLGPGTNRDFLLWCLKDGVFTGGETTTRYLEDRLAKDPPARPDMPDDLVALAAALLAGAQAGDRWASREGLHWPVLLAGEGDAEPIRAEVEPGAGRTRVHLAHGVHVDLRAIERAGPNVFWDAGGHRRSARIWSGPDRVALSDGRASLNLRNIVNDTAMAEDEAGSGRVLAPMDGLIRRVVVGSGAKVARGDLLVVLEAMKMENELRAGTDGTVTAIHTEEGRQVAREDILVEIEPAE